MSFPSGPGAPPPSSGNEQQSSASIFEHVDRISRTTEASRRVPSKIQLIAMQPIPAPPVQHPVLADRVAETNKINKEVFAFNESALLKKLMSHFGQCQKVSERSSITQLLIATPLQMCPVGDMQAECGD